MTAEQRQYFGFAIALVTCIIAGVANIPFNAMPMIIGTAADHFNLVPREIGLLGGVTLFGWVAGTALCFFCLHRTNWRYMAAVSIIGAVIGLQFSLWSMQIPLLYLSWFVLGLGASIPTCIAFEIMAQTRNPERSFGMFTFSVVLVSGLTLYLFPVFLLGKWGYAGLVYGLGGLFLALLALVWMLPTTHLTQSQSHQIKETTESNTAAWIAFAAFLIFFSGQSGLWAFLERAGKEIELPPEEIGLILSILKMVGGLAGVAAMVLADRFGNRWPFVAGFLGVLAGVTLLDQATDATTYAIGGWVWEFFFTLVFCYSTAAVSRIDLTGRVVVLMPGAIGLGGAFGPSIAGFLKTGPGFFPIYMLATVCMFVAMVVFLVLLSRKAKPLRNTSNNKDVS